MKPYRLAVLFLLVHLHFDLTGGPLLGSTITDYVVAALLAQDWSTLFGRRDDVDTTR